MSFIGFGIYGLLRRTGLPYLFSAVTAGMIMIVYTLMIGASVSAVRALIMFLIRAGADVCGRDYDLPTSLSVSAVSVCMFQPLYLQDAAFQLSYGAVLGIALFSPVFADMLCISWRNGMSNRKETEKLRKHLRNTGKKIFSGAGTALSVNCLLMGPLLYFYFEIPVYSVLLNLFVIPGMSLLMGAGLAGSFLAQIADPAGGAVLVCCKVLLTACDRICSFASDLPGNRLVTGRPSILWLAVYYFILTAIYVWYRYIKKNTGKDEDSLQNRISGRKLGLPGIMIICAGAVMPYVCRAENVYREDVCISVLDVGQGDGIFIQSPSGVSCFIDGGSSDTADPGTYRIEPFLLSRGTDELEYVFLTHGDEDHLNGIQEMIRNQKFGVRIRTLVLPPDKFLDQKLIRTAYMARENKIRVVQIKEGDRIKVKEKERFFTLTCLGPQEDLEAEKGSNEASVVLELSYGAFSMLFTGDVEGTGEASLMESPYLKRCTVLKAAHHGSRSSGSEEFLQIVRPAAAVISAGRDNRYGHPHRETMERLKKAGCAVYSTQDYGAITILTDGEKVRINGWLDTGKKNLRRESVFPSLR